MQNNVINFDTGLDLPDDAITVSKFCAKYTTSKSYIYKLIHKGLVKPYPYGLTKISESQTRKAIMRKKTKWQA